MMDCLEAQSLISQALDRAPVDATALAEAKAHCRTCPECGVFVSALAAIQRATPPQPPEDLAGRVMDALALDIARTRAEAAHTNQATASSGAQPAATAHAGTPDMTLKQRLADPRSRRTLALWSAAAAVVIIAAGFGAVSGVRQIIMPNTAGEFASEQQAEDSVASVAPEANTLTAPEQAPSGDTQDKQSRTAQKAPGYIVVAGTVYALSSATADENMLSSSVVIGSTNTPLATEEAPSRRDVYGSADRQRVFIKSEGDAPTRVFDRVVRQYRGATYALQSDEIAEYGGWPTLPSSIPEPRADGSPTFTFVEETPDGVAVYRLSNANPEQGIAIPPGTAGVDPAAGNPGWTWWIPVQ